MYQITPTKNFGGMKITGDYNDMDTLVDAIYDLADSEYNAYLGYSSQTEHFLGLAYDIRHAYQGDREHIKVDNGSESWNKDWDTGKKVDRNIGKDNLYYSVNIPMIQLMFDMFLIEDLISLREEHEMDDMNNPITKVSKDIFSCKSDKEKARLTSANLLAMKLDFMKKTDKDEVDIETLKMQDRHRSEKSVAVIRLFRAVVFDAIVEVLGIKEKTILVTVYKEQLEKKKGRLYKDFFTQYVEELEIQYLQVISKSSRKKHLASTIFLLINKDTDGSYQAMEKELRKEALRQGASIDKIRYQYSFDWENMKW